ncbi:MAG TPA: TCP-1/cpn60 chaperonin family protein, partial [Pseudonocardiaceae bacterium]|nr:TCP-1/cpn60 chaperonin family protein [Pseudonocardiaceae bacterium]
ACGAPVAWIANNAGFEGSVVVAKVREMDWGHGFDAEAETYCDLVAAGIVDPVKVTRSAIVNAASIARMVITTQSAVVDTPEQQAPAAGHGHGHGHGPGM